MYLKIAWKKINHFGQAMLEPRQMLWWNHNNTLSTLGQDGSDDVINIGAHMYTVHMSARFNTILSGQHYAMSLCGAGWGASQTAG